MTSFNRVNHRQNYISVPAVIGWEMAYMDDEGETTVSLQEGEEEFRLFKNGANPEDPCFLWPDM